MSALPSLRSSPLPLKQIFNLIPHARLVVVIYTKIFNKRLKKYNFLAYNTTRLKRIGVIWMNSKLRYVAAKTFDFLEAIRLKCVLISDKKFQMPQFWRAMLLINFKVSNESDLIVLIFLQPYAKGQEGHVTSA